MKSPILKGLTFLALACFSLILWFLTCNLATKDILRIIPDNLVDSTNRKVKLINDFGETIAIYFDDGEAGQFLDALKAKEEMSVSAMTGQDFYATKLNGWIKLEYITIQFGLIEYHFGAQSRSTIAISSLSIEIKTRPHPNIVPLTAGHSTAVGALFRNLSRRKVELWFDDGRNGIQQGHLAMGQETTTNAYEGHVFIITIYGKKSEEICRFTISKEQVLIFLFNCHFIGTVCHL